MYKRNLRLRWKHTVYRLRRNKFPTIAETQEKESETMYGLLLQSIKELIKEEFGEETWEAIRKKADVPYTFITHKPYSESMVVRISRAAHEVTNVPRDVLMERFGLSFVGFVGRFGYDRILRVLGRNFRDFLNNLDNLHEYLRFSYPKLKPPSFFIEQESRQGLLLHYRSRRRGFVKYVKGQIIEVGRKLYNTQIQVEVVSENETREMTHVVMKLKFDNKTYRNEDATGSLNSRQLPISSETFFDVFPFHLVFSNHLVVQNVGRGLQAVMIGLLGKHIDDEFSLSRPMVDFTWENILAHTNNVFELQSMNPVRNQRDDESYMAFDWRMNDSAGTGSISGDTMTDLDDDLANCLVLKGQMMHMKEWNAVVFLGTPVLDNLEAMHRSGLFINDLSMHDSSRDLVLAGTQQSAELKLALDQEQQKSRKLEESMRKLDIEMRRTDSLLYQMIPKTVADRLRKGEDAMDTCEAFEQVTILFSDVVGFTSICSQITPMGVVSMLNAMYTKFDKLTEKHQVYKVETIGDAYMVVSGAPVRTKLHAQFICDMALDMVKSMTELDDPSTDGHMKIRVGCHSGNVVAGVVGLKMPRYCLFGDTVNVASRLETNGEAMKIHVSETTKTHLEGWPYKHEERGYVDLKGSGSEKHITIKTYWLEGRETKHANELSHLPI
ncbi:unnamed protein product [Owenia fusiformis]|uniref:guanylate cyclase n=1 Tax=Owenia fusiformis TaxID=6347 RepID=A0A8J1V2C5_OWEFU|nr:unnamed protein product [Owenia fusiformis]